MIAYSQKTLGSRFRGNERVRLGRLTPAPCPLTPDPLSLCRAAGVDRQHRAGDIFRLVAEQELDRVGDILDGGKATQRAAPRYLLALLVAKALGHLRVHESRRDGVDVDAEPADLARA